MPTLDETNDDHTPAPRRHTGRLPSMVVQEGPGGDQLVTLVDAYSGAAISAGELVEVER